MSVDLRVYTASGPIHTWPPPPRAPLPPQNEGTWETADPNVPVTFHPVFTTLPQEPPDKPDIRFWRGDVWGVTVPGLPHVEGAATPGTPAAERVLTYFLGRYGRAWEDRILEAHRAAGYTHMTLLGQDEFAYGMSEAEFIAMSKRVKAAGFFVHQAGRSKYYTDAHNPDLTIAQRIGEKLLDAGACDIWTPAGEMNYWSPAIVRQMIDQDAAWLNHRARMMLHFYPHYISWPEDKVESSAEWWHKNTGKVDGVLYQGDPSWTAGMMAARLQDVQVRLVAGGVYQLPVSYDVVAYEDIATQQYANGSTGNGRLADEAEGNLRGFENCCVPGPIRISGYGNGGRRPDGSAL